MQRVQRAAPVCPPHHGAKHVQRAQERRERPVAEPELPAMHERARHRWVQAPTGHHQPRPAFRRIQAIVQERGGASGLDWQANDAENWVPAQFGKHYANRVV